MSSHTTNLGTTFRGSKEGKIVEAKGIDRPVGPNDVVISLTHSGLCGTDLHFLGKDMVLGHEGVGVITEIGSAVKHRSLGERVGYGYVRDSCGVCLNCLDGYDTMCKERVDYGSKDLDQASFADKIVIPEPFVHTIPDSLSLADAAPLQCAGATVYGAIYEAGVSSFNRVGVVGIGGLGHLAIQVVAAMGCETVVFSGTKSKEDEARKLGATEFHAVKENPKLQGVKPVDVLIVSTSGHPDYKLYTRVVAQRGQIIPLTVSSDPFTIPHMTMIGNSLRVQGSYVARRAVHRRMLDFFGSHPKARPMIETLPMTLDGLNEASKRLEKGDVRYRFVLESQTNKEEDLIRQAKSQK
ncbi:hypothetical protein OC846_002477 [Tilletia horrida]|uniref:Enoyl reductase (ER) domain-containing protein n=1 Tax=Tilletia horrida TaxID=155126 RepID=A0AAN6GRT9_9BASI|nr:hypothetical protein OC845_001897 [Tilletia horrida]KAK0553556.1 hypothetical protein OC846_002477 [Tilletia horrida]KAK0568215.1 hypothetical protein OC861_002158 [Tilletia horrida]